jgi:hypothetical protein
LLFVFKGVGTVSGGSRRTEASRPEQLRSPACPARREYLVRPSNAHR